ncbi:MAG TPA: hypothetical protein VIY71_04105 [Solirubrobacterales bacterium]
MNRGLLSNVVLLGVAVGCLLIIAGCGDSSSDSSQATGGGNNATTRVDPDVHPSKAEFVKQASAICVATKERASEEFATYIQKNTSPTSGPGVVAKATDAVNTVFSPVYQLQVERISALGAPQGDEQQINAILTAMQQGIERAKQQPLQFLRRNTALSQASKLAKAYGLPACSTVSS